MEKTIKQHWIPKFILKKFLNEDNIMIFKEINIDKVEEIIYQNSSKKFFPDYFFEENFYEEKNRENNEIENKLSIIETKFAKILQRLEEKISNTNINFNFEINRKELDILKCFFMISTFRTKTIRERAENLEGDDLFNSINKNKTQEEIIEIQNQKINKLLSMTIDLHKKPWNIENRKNFLFFENSLDDVSWINFFSTSLKIFYSSFGFIQTDSLSSQIINPIFSPQSLINIYPISKNIAFGLLFSNGFTRQGIGNEEFSNKIKEGIELISEKLNINKEKFFIFDGKQKYKNEQNNSEPKFTWEDKFKYSINLLNKNETNTINAFMFSQARNFVFSHQEKTINEAEKLKKELNIFRVEDIN